MYASIPLLALIIFDHIQLLLSMEDLPYRRLDGVIVTGADVKDYVLPNSIQSALEYIHEISNIYVISPHKNSIELAAKYSTKFGARVQFVDEEYFNITRTMMHEVMFTAGNDIKFDVACDES
jgi:hypothetical protein